MSEEKRRYPPDVGSELDLPCGCQTWTSQRAFVVMPCTTSCPNYLWLVAEGHRSGPVEYRQAWSR